MDAALVSGLEVWQKRTVALTAVLNEKNFFLKAYITDRFDEYELEMEVI